MEFFDVLSGRRSVRRFKPDRVSEADIRRIVEAATLAPNGSNVQPWRFVALTSPDKIQGLRKVVDDKMASLTGAKEAASERNFTNLFAWAPVVICVLQGPYHSHTDVMLKDKAPELVEDRLVVVNTALQSVSAAVALLTLAAHALGYGTCWMTGPLVARKEIEKLLEAPADYNVVAILPLGVPEGPLSRAPRKPVDEVLEIR